MQARLDGPNRKELSPRFPRPERLYSGYVDDGHGDIRKLAAQLTGFGANLEKRVVNLSARFVEDELARLEVKSDVQTGDDQLNRPRVVVEVSTNIGGVHSTTVYREGVRSELMAVREEEPTGSRCGTSA